MAVQLAHRNERLFCVEPWVKAYDVVIFDAPPHSSWYQEKDRASANRKETRTHIVDSLEMIEGDERVQRHVTREENVQKEIFENLVNCKYNKTRQEDLDLSLFMEALDFVSLSPNKGIDANFDPVPITKEHNRNFKDRTKDNICVLYNEFFLNRNFSIYKVKNYRNQSFETDARGVIRVTRKEPGDFVEVDCENNESLCVVCNENPKDVLCLPCMHFSLCLACCLILKANSMDENSYFYQNCIICRCVVTKCLRVIQ
jgi:Zinc finger, C3HC4 type (RING finger)